MTTKAIILGDLHLGKGLNIGKPGIGSQLNSRILDQLKILYWVLNLALEEEVSDLIITGDIFEDPKPHPTIINLFVQFVKQCSEFNLRLHLLEGNHDILRSGQYTMSALDILASAEIKNINIYKTIKTITIDDISFTFLPFKDRRSFNTNSNQEALEKLKLQIDYELASIALTNKKILVGHLALEGSIYIGDEFDDLSNELFCPLTMFRNYNYTYMGHVHKFQELSQNPYIAHIGSMDLSDFGESNHTKKIAILDFSQPNNILKYINIPTRPLKYLKISIPENEFKINEYLYNFLQKENLKNAILKVDIFFENPEAPMLDKTMLERFFYEEKKVFYVFRIAEERKLLQVKKTSIEIDNTISEKNAIKIWMDTNVEKKYADDFLEKAMHIVTELDRDI